MIIVEGIDGVGKSTFVKNLSSCGFKRYHFEYDEKNMDLYSKYNLVLAKSDNRMALDRSFISEMVYGPVIRGESKLTNKEFINLLKLYNEQDCKLFYLYATRNCLLNRRSDDVSDYNMLFEYYDALSVQYEKVISICSQYLDTITFDTESLPIEEIDSQTKKVLQI